MIDCCRIRTNKAIVKSRMKTLLLMNVCHCTTRFYWLCICCDRLFFPIAALYSCAAGFYRFPGRGPPAPPENNWLGLMSSSPNEEGGLSQAASNENNQDLLGKPTQSGAKANTPEEQVRVWIDSWVVRTTVFTWTIKLIMMNLNAFSSRFPL